MKSLQEKSLLQFIQFYESSGRAWLPTMQFGSLWPVIRAALYFAVRKKNTSKDRKEINTGLTLNKNAVHEARDCLAKSLGCSRDLSVLYFSRADVCHDKVNGMTFDRFGDPCNLLLPARTWNKILVDVTEPLIPGKSFNSLDVSHSDLEIRGVYEENIDKILQELNNILFINISKEALFSYLQIINYYIRLAHGWLSKERPHVVILTCFYSPATFAITYASNRMKIPVYDLQHGQLGENHLMAMHWESASNYEQDSSFLPHGFITWGENTSQRISDTCTGLYKPKTLTLGNPWLDFWRNGFFQEQSLSDSKAPNSVFNNEPLGTKRLTRILVALQPLENLLDDFVFDVLRDSKVEPIFRPHPHQIGDLIKIREFLENRLGHGKFHLQDGSESLYPTLSKVDAVVTRFSTVAWEAVAFGKKVALIDLRAREIYGKFIEESVFSLCLNGNELYQFICTHSSTPNITTTFFANFIDSFPNVIKRL
jgi:hypothetical protein